MQQESAVQLVLEFAPCGDLKSWLRSPHGSDMPPATAYQILAQVTQGLQHVHSMHIVHRDISARNVLLFDEYMARVTLADFGLGRFLPHEATYYRSSTLDDMPSG